MLRRLVAKIIYWLRYRSVDHFELRWRPPGGRGWRRVEDDDRLFDPSDLESPIPYEHFHSHAKTQRYYQGEYRLVPINDKGQMGKSVWQEHFYAGPSLEAEQQREREKQEQQREMLREVEEIAEMIREEYT